MLDRFLKLIIAGTLALFFFQAVIGVLARAFHAGLRELLGALGTVGGFIGYVLGVVIVVGFLIGLLVRATQLIANRDPRAARERATRIALFCSAFVGRPKACRRPRATLRYLMTLTLRSGMRSGPDGRASRCPTAPAAERLGSGHRTALARCH
jgi:hypothetical protein